MEEEQNLAFSIQPIGKLDVDGIRLVLNHTEISTDYSDNENTTTSPQYFNNNNNNKNTNNRYNEEYDNENDDNDNYEDDDDDDEYSDANSDNISNNNNNNTTTSKKSTNIISPTTSTSSNETEDWLSKMSMDITSDGQIMVIGGGGNGAIGTGLALILQKKQNDPTSQWRTTITLDHQTQNGTDRITSIQFVPINSHIINYVVAIGYTSGYLRVFSIQGNLLLSQLFYNKPILKIKVKNTSILPIGDIMVQPKYLVHELTLVYPDNIVVNISGLTFISVIQVCLNQRSGGGGGGGGSGGGGGENNLSFKKWTLGNSVDRINDVTFCGPFLGSPFRALPYSTTEQSMIRLVGVGSNPMISFYYPTEDGGSSFSIMISSITSRLTTAVFSYAKNWWGGKQDQQQQQQQQQQRQPHQEKPVPLALRWAITDFKREIISINIDPSGRYAISTDNLGRVLLIDLVNSLVVKIWKGYRDCQCGFVSVVENNNNNNNDNENNENNENNEDLEDFIPRKLLKKSSSTLQSRTYLVIYLGRRGILEIWGLKHRSREYFKTIGKGCKLISTTTPSFFQNQSTSQNLRNSGGAINISNIPQYNISEGQSHCFILYTDGSIKEIKYNYQ
ncbi:hypothetical protein ACTFIW_002923 [Dictyostelium discoideum]